MKDTTFDLYNWQFPNKEYTLKNLSQAAGYAISASFWYDVIKDNDKDVIKKLIL